MIQITHNIAISESEIQLEFIRSSGPGGQNVNKVATSVQLRFDVTNSPSLPDEVRERLNLLAGRQVTGDGILIINAHRFRTQGRNRQDAMNRLVALIQTAVQRPKVRRRTRATLASKMRRIESKRHHSATKSMRRPIQPTNE